MKIISLHILIAFACCVPATSADKITATGAGTGTHLPVRINADDPIRDALRDVAKVRQAEITPILAQKHAAIRKIMDNKTLSADEKKESIRLASADFDAKVSAIFTRTSAKMDEIFASRTQKSKGRRN